MPFIRLVVRCSLSSSCVAVPVVGATVALRAADEDRQAVEGSQRLVASREREARTAAVIRERWNAASFRDARILRGAGPDGHQRLASAGATAADVPGAFAHLPRARTSASRGRLRAMRWAILGLVFTAFGVAGWQALLVAQAPRAVEKLVQELANAPDAPEADVFAQRLTEALAREGVAPAGLVVTASHAEAVPDGTRRSISVKLDGRRRLLVGSADVKAFVQVLGVVPDDVKVAASHFPSDAERLPLKPLVPGRALVAFADVVEEKDTAWSSTTRDGAFTVTSAEYSKGCELRCESKTGELKWSDKGPCQVRKQHLRFVSDDCERVVAFDTASFPSRWQAHRVAYVLDRAQLAWAVAAVTVVSSDARVRSSRGWLRGFSAIGGPGPDFRADAKAIVFTTVEGQQHEIPLEKAPPTQ
ncbi:MAG: hypothetical protein MUC96_21665 [Myxococcaceae bacterium]|jgi:hypothetical protein|nr:hypothetical protein [Myxococcaceae bacterium]